MKRWQPVLVGRSWQRVRLVLGVLALLWPQIQGAQASALLEGRDLSFSAADGGAKVRHFAPELGDLRGPVTQGDTVWLGIGPEVYGFDQAGNVTARLDFPGPISALDAGVGTQGLLTVTAGFPGAQSTFTVSDSQIRERVVFAPLPEITNWLERAAQLATPAEVRNAESSDPTNPFLALRHAQLSRSQGDQLEALSEVQRAATLEVPFAASLRLAALLEQQHQPAAANLLLSRAARDYAARGYDPAVPVSRASLASYGDPLSEINLLLKGGHLERADVWLRYLRGVSPRFEHSAAVYEYYASVLDSQGRSGEAQEWRSFSRSLNAGTLYNLGPDALLSIQDAARLLAWALLLSLLAAYALLLVRIWPLQGQDTAAEGGRWRAWRRPFWRLRRSVLGYAGIGEKLVIAALLLGLLLSVSAWTWAGHTQTALSAPAMNMGTYGGAWFYDHMGETQTVNRDADLLRGLAAQLDSDETQARRAYQASPDLDIPTSRLNNVTTACIQNNLGVMLREQDDIASAREQWRVALSASPDLLSAAYNLGLQTTDPRAAFQRQNLAGVPMLCYPDQRSLISALGGNLTAQLSMLWRAPVATLLSTPTGLSMPWQWGWVLGLLGAAAYSLLSLLLPAARTGLAPAGTRAGFSSARSRQSTLGGLPRAPLFRLLALLLPGSALLDGAWGGVLLLAWAGVLLHWLGSLGAFGWHFDYLPVLTTPLALLLLTLMYILNVAALALGQWRYWRKLRRG